MSLLKYYNPRDERYWTGDIFDMPTQSPMKYSVILTPACDFAQGSPKDALFGFGFKLDKQVPDDQTSILYEFDPKLADLANAVKAADNKDDRDKAKNRYTSRKRAYLAEEGPIPSTLES